LLGYSQTSGSVEKLDSLTQSIRHLCVKDDMASFEDYEWPARACLERLEDFLADWKSLAPRLEGIDLRLRESHHQWDEDEQEELRDMCERAGVACSITKELPI